MTARCEDHDENSSSSPSSFFSSSKKKLETECCFGKKAMLLFLLAESVYVTLAIVKVTYDLRSTVGIFTTITALYHHANNTNEEDDGGIIIDESSTNTSATNIPIGSVATDSTVPTIFKNCSPEEPNVRGCDVGERCTKFLIETDVNNEENDNTNHQHPSRIKNRINDNFNTDDDESKERETWYCIPESYFSTPTSSSSPTPKNLNEVCGFDTSMML